LTNYVFAHSKYSSGLAQRGVMADLLIESDEQQSPAVNEAAAHVCSMTQSMRNRANWLIPCAAVGALLAALPQASRSADDPRDWLQKMNHALATRITTAPSFI